MIVSEMKGRVHGIQQRARRSASDLPSPRTSVQSTSDYELLSRIPDASAGIARSRYCQCPRRNGVCTGDLRSVRPPTVELSGIWSWCCGEIKTSKIIMTVDQGEPYQNTSRNCVRNICFGMISGGQIVMATQSAGFL
jgi:hypothetical protein